MLCRCDHLSALSKSSVYHISVKIFIRRICSEISSYSHNTAVIIAKPRSLILMQDLTIGTLLLFIFYNGPPYIADERWEDYSRERFR
jgi:hypothetical protein